MLALTLYTVMQLASQPVPTPSYWGDLEPGPHIVGFTQRWVTDSTRRLPGGEQYGLRYRPILLNLWYPATRATRQTTQYDEYFAGAVQAADHDDGLARYARDMIAYQRRIAWSELAGAEPDSTTGVLKERVEALFRTQTFAFRDAPRSQAEFPVVLYTSGAQSSMDDNVVLCEYLASKGFLVIGSPFPQEDNTSFATNGSDESRQRDVRRLLLEVSRVVRHPIGSVTVIGHSMGAQAMQLFAADPSAPIDRIISLDTTQDYAMLTDHLWAWYTDVLLEHRHEVRTPIMFVAGPAALFELADSLVASPRTLVTVPNLQHNDFISQGIIRKQIHAGLPDDDADLEEASGAYVSLLRYIESWLESQRRGAGIESPSADPPLAVLSLPAGENLPAVGSEPPRSAREVRHLFGAVPATLFADLVAQARTEAAEIATDQVLMMLLVDAIRRGQPEQARTVYDALVNRDATTRGIATAIENRARIFERIGATVEAEEWRGLLRVLEGDTLRLP